LANLQAVQHQKVYNSIISLHPGMFPQCILMPLNFLFKLKVLRSQILDAAHQD
jgi:hypothetical protein